MYSKRSKGRSGAGCPILSRVAEPAPGRRDDPPKRGALPERTHRPMTTRRLLLAAPALLPLAARAQAQRTARLVVPFPAGGATDGLARLWVPGFSQRIGLPVVVDNRPGAGGVPAADVVAKAAPDGLTLLLATSSIASTGPAVNPALPYDVERDFTPLCLLASRPRWCWSRPPCPRRPWRSSSPGRGRGGAR
jgi:tripartite-type tricarboxylate transporter receptor subunit TctC